MTQEEKIAALVEHIKKEFPRGCIGAQCSDCIFYKKKDMIDEAVCEMLWNIEKKLQEE